MTQAPNGQSLERPEFQRVVSTLNAARALARFMLVAQRLSWVGSVGVALVAIGVFSDYFLRFPMLLRIGALLVAAAIFVQTLLRWLVPALRFKPDLTEVALRLERSPAGAAAGLEGRLASAVDLAAGHGAGVPQFALSAIEDAGRRFTRIGASSVLSGGRTARALMWVAAVGAAAVGAFAVWPTHAPIGVQRILAPWTDAQWPKRTAIADATNLKVHPLGAALPMKAALLRSSGEPSEERVIGRYRIIDSQGQGGPVRKVLLTCQDKHIVVTKQGNGTSDGAPSRGATVDSGVLFERLIEPGGLVASTDDAGETGELTLEYWFETEDDRTQAARVILVEPPAVVGAVATVAPPSYAQVDAAQSTVDLGRGNDERAMLRAALEGSRITLRIKINKPVPAVDAGDQERSRSFASRALGPDVAALFHDSECALEIAFLPDEWILEWTLTHPVMVAVAIADEHGIRSSEESVFRFDAVADRPPTATVLQPSEDESVLLGATVALDVEGRDDLGLASLAIQKQIARTPKGSEGRAYEPVEEPATLDEAMAGGDAADQRMVLSHSLVLAASGAEEGDEMWISALAKDRFELNGRRHDATRSAVRKLRIISAGDLIDQVWAQLGSVREAAIRLDEEQQRLKDEAATPGLADRSARAQGQISERISRERREIQRLQERISRNGLADDDMAEILRQAGDLTDRAGTSSVQASEAIEPVARAERSGDQVSDKDRAAASQQQDAVRDSLSDLITLLDQGQDTFAMKRQVERLLKEQEDLLERTREAAAQTTGKAPGDLTAEEKQNLEQIAADQRSSAQRAADAIAHMLAQESEVAKHDQAAAQAMGDAARQGQRSRVPERMQDAAEQVERNQTNSAQGSQQQAIRSLEEMLNRMKNADRDRDEVLRRQLASIMESLDGLIRRQEESLAALGAAVAAARAPEGGLEPEREREVFEPLEGPMIALHQNTLGVVTQAQGERGFEDLVKLVKQAAEEQSGAVEALRATPVDQAAAQSAEESSLEQLKKARELAEKLDKEAEDREAAREREELRKAYEEALREQMAIRDDIDGLSAQESTRRTRAAARAAGEREAALRDSLADLLGRTTELSESVLFEYAHDRLDGMLAGIINDLAAGDATKGTARQAGHAVRILKSLVDALESPEQDDEFREQEVNQDGGGGGNQNGKPKLVPSIAELRLLRAMQQEAADRTRDAEEAAHRGEDVGSEALEIGSLQQALAERGQRLLERLTGGEEEDIEAPELETPEPKDNPGGGA